jgi:hypothetical protein
MSWQPMYEVKVAYKEGGEKETRVRALDVAIMIDYSDCHCHRRRSRCWLWRFSLVQKHPAKGAGSVKDF